MFPYRVRHPWAIRGESCDIAGFIPPLLKAVVCVILYFTVVRKEIVWVILYLVAGHKEDFLKTTTGVYGSQSLQNKHR